MDRHQVIQIRVSPDEKALIEERAAEHGKPPSAYARECALEGSIKRFMDSKRAPDPAEKEPLTRKKREEIMQGVERETWVAKRTTELKPRMSSRAAARQAEIEWDEKHS